MGVPPPPTAFFAISFNDYDKLRLIGVPSELIPSIQQTLGPANIQKEEWREGRAAYQIKLYEEFYFEERFFFISFVCFSDEVHHGWHMVKKRLLLDLFCCHYSIV